MHPTILTVSYIVVGFILSFRSSTAYERHIDNRKNVVIPHFHVAKPGARNLDIHPRARRWTRQEKHYGKVACLTLIIAFSLWKQALIWAMHAVWRLAQFGGPLEQVRKRIGSSRQAAQETATIQNDWKTPTDPDGPVEPSQVVEARWTYPRQPFALNPVLPPRIDGRHYRER